MPDIVNNNVVEDKRIFGTVLYDFICHNYDIINTNYEDGVQYFKIDDNKLKEFTFVLRQGYYNDTRGMWVDIIVDDILDKNIINTLLFNNCYKLFVKIDYYESDDKDKFDLLYPFELIQAFIRNIRKHHKFIHYMQIVPVKDPKKIKSKRQINKFVKNV